MASEEDIGRQVQAGIARQKQRQTLGLIALIPLGFICVFIGMAFESAWGAIIPFAGCYWALSRWQRG